LTRWTLAAPAPALCALTLTACTQGLAISDAWIRLLPGDLPAAGYFVLYNDSDRPATLVGASAPSFERVEVHQSVERQGLESMIHMDAVGIRPHETLRFQPGGYHLMFMGPRRALAVGDVEPVTLRLADGTELTVEFAVRSATGTSEGQAP
jgi:copper(I)-binding protein